MKNYFFSLTILFNSTNNMAFYLKEKKIHINKSINNISSVNIFSNKSIPSFYNSAMDGYAISSSSASTLCITKLKSKVFYVIDTLKAGEFLEFDFFDFDFVIEIMTGARVPSVFDSVIKLEDVLLINSNEIIIKKQTKNLENIKIIGEDFGINDIILKKGKVISNNDILSLSAFGIDFIKVIQKPKIYILSTGDEIINYNISKFNDGVFINNSTSNYIFNFFKSLDFDVNYLGTTNDNYEEFKNKIKILLSSNIFSIFISTGAVSKGVADFIPTTLRFLGFDILFHGVKIKPGKPILICKNKKNIYFFCLPGNPISSIVGIRFFVYPFLRYLLGLSLEKPLKAKLTSNFIFNNKCDTFLKSYCYYENSTFCVKILKSQESFKINSYSKSNSFVFIKNFDNVKCGDFVDVFLYNPVLYD